MNITKLLSKKSNKLIFRCRKSLDMELEYIYVYPSHRTYLSDNKEFNDLNISLQKLSKGVKMPKIRKTYLKI
jgi:hypothetical protein